MNQIPTAIVRGSRVIKVVEDAKQRAKEDAQLRLARIQNKGEKHPKKAG